MSSALSGIPVLIERMAAWMMIQISGNSSVHFLNRRHMEKELRKNLEALCILNFEKDDVLIQEWYDFARRFLYSCTSCKSYGSTLFGMIISPGVRSLAG